MQELGRLEDLPEVGSFITFDILDDSVLVTRTGENEYAAHWNVCTHRGTQRKRTPK